MFLKFFFILFFFFIYFIFRPSFSDEALYLEDNFFPEGITVSENGDIYVGSLKENKIVKIPNGKKNFEEFIPSASNGLLSVIGIIADDYNNILWVCSSNPGVTNYPSNEPVSLKAFDLVSGNFINSYPFPDGGFCNDIAIDKNHNVYVTDSFNPRILRLNKSQNRLETWLESPHFEGEGFNLNGITYNDGWLFMVKMNSGELFRVEIKENGEPNRLESVFMSRKLNAPDGIKTIDKRNLIVVENNGSLTLIKLKTAGGNWSQPKLCVLRENLDTPTTVGIKNNTAWVLEAQFGHLFGEEKNILPDRFKIVGVDINLKTSLLTRLKNKFILCP